MRLLSENLIIISRISEANEREVLVGKKLRGSFEGYMTFPGGKAEGNRPQSAEAVRELREETSIRIASKELTYAGKLLIQDQRAGKEAFGNVFIFLGNVGMETVAKSTAELEPSWRNANSPTLTDGMPLDVVSWWPTVREFDGTPFVTHIMHDEDGDMDVITKLPDFQNTPGTIIDTRHFPAH